jgi:hypothetical protein
MNAFPFHVKSICAVSVTFLSLHQKCYLSANTPDLLFTVKVEIQFFVQTKLRGNLRHQIKIARKGAPPVTAYSEATKMAGINGDKMKSAAKNRKLNSRRSELLTLDNFDLCVIRQTIHNVHILKKHKIQH